MRSICAFIPGLLCDPGQGPSLSGPPRPHLNKKEVKLDEWFSKLKTLEPLRIKSELNLIKLETALGC